MIFIFILVACYALSLLVGSILYAKIEQTKGRDEQNDQAVTMVVAFRNEEKNLIRLAKSIVELNYPKSQIELVFVNDHSEDNGLKILHNYLQECSLSAKVESLPKHKNGKKDAIELGVSLASHELIYCTDADCILDKDNLSNLISLFNAENIQFVTGQVRFLSTNFISDILNIEMAPLLGVTALSIHSGKPIMANGANLSFRKQAFLKAKEIRNDYNTPTGDDVFLLSAINQLYGPESIQFSKDSLVLTNSPDTVNEFLNQRLRWASKWKANSTLFQKVSGVIIWVLHFLLLTSFGWLFYLGEYTLLITLMATRAVGEYFFIRSVLLSQKQKMKFIPFLLCYFFYSFYVLFIGICANFMHYQWKGRYYGRTN